MSNPTTPFGWQMPTNTDLVTDLPADFEVFGQAVATDLQYLLGGTTGQVLAKASATDLDFVWSADAAGMTNPMTTTGDIIYSSPGSTPVRRGIGSAGQVLTVASGIPTWSTPASGGKVLQVVQGTTSTNTTIATTSLTDTTLTATITPTLATSKILVMTTQQVTWSRTAANATLDTVLLRGATTIVDYATADKSIGIIEAAGATDVSQSDLFNIIYLDSPATTSATTYKTQARLNTTANNATSRFQDESNPSSIILMEIGA